MTIGLKKLFQRPRSQGKSLSVGVPTREQLAELDLDKVLLIEIESNAHTIYMGITREQLKIITTDLLRLCHVLNQEEDLVTSIGDFESGDDGDPGLKNKSEGDAHVSEVKLAIFSNKNQGKNLHYFS